MLLTTVFARKPNLAKAVSSLIVGVALAPALHAEVIGGVYFPQGAISFADEVVSYNPEAGGSAVPSAANADPTKALGAPQIPGNTAVSACSDVNLCKFVSLGDGGSIVLKFTDNLLTGSDSPALDLWVFEVGPDVEDTHVEISKDGIVWYSVGTVYGTTSGIDIDAYGFTSSDHFAYVRLTDDTWEGGQTGPSVGADIDAVGAITTIPYQAPAAPQACNTDDALTVARQEGFNEGYSLGRTEGYEIGLRDGFLNGKASVEPQIITVVEYVEVPVEVIKIVEVIKEVSVAPAKPVVNRVTKKEPPKAPRKEVSKASKHEPQKGVKKEAKKETVKATARDDNGHGNDVGKFDPSNPGKSKR